MQPLVFYYNIFSMPKLQPSVLTRFMPILSGLFYLALIVFLYNYIQSIDFASLSGASLDWRLLALASLFGMSMRAWQVGSWFIILRGLGATGLGEHRVQLVYVYAKSWLARYIPGTAPWILGKIYFASKHGIAKSKLAVSSLLEAGLQVVVILALGLVILAADSRFDVMNTSIRLTMVLLLCACIVLLIPAVFNRMIDFAFRFLRRRTLTTEHHASGSVVASGVVMYGVGALLYGTFLFYLAQAVYPQLGYDTFIFVIGTSSLAGALGIVSFFAPSGLGVRDGIQLLLLSVIMPPEFALIITVLTRLWDIVLDVLFFAFAWLLRALQPNK